MFLCFFSIAQANSQTLNIEKVSVSGCYYSGGSSKCVVSVQVGWTGLVAGNNITVTLGSQTKTIQAESKPAYTKIVTPQVVAFEISSDGSSGNITATQAAKSLSAADIYTAQNPCEPLACNGTDLGGQVYFDYNNDGVHQSTETQGQSGVIVTATDKNGVTYTTTTDGKGMWKLPIPAAGYCVRVEYSNIPSSLRNSSTIAGGTTVQFYNGATCSADLGVLDISDYSQADPRVYVPVWTNGDPSHASNASRYAISTFNYSTTGNPLGGGQISNSGVIPFSYAGALWGMAWDRKDKKVYSSAIIRRHAGLGVQGIAGIYVYDPVANSYTSYDLEATTGEDFGTISSNSSRGLTAPSTPSWDIDAHAKVGKMGIGAISINETGTLMYVMNLYKKQIVVVDLPAMTLNKVINVPDPGCTGGDYRPWSCTYYKGNLFVGVVCDAQSSQNKSNLTATIYKIDPTTSTSTNILEFPLTYPKGYPNSNVETGWVAWSDNYMDMVNSNIASGVNTNGGYPTPILADIDFDIDGAMVIALDDRTSWQFGYYNHLPDPTFSDNRLWAANAGGDILRAYYSNGIYALENGGKAGPLSGSHPTNNEGPGFGEFFNDNFTCCHTETMSGGIAIKPGSGEVAGTFMDPNNTTSQIFAGGVKYLNNSNGAYSRAYNIYGGSNNLNTFGKSNGLGDIVFAVDEPDFSQIGNRVWQDSDADGVQDPCEPGISGVTMKLYDATGALVGTTTTDANGNYYFGNGVNGISLTPGANYYVVAGSGQYTSANGLVAGGNSYGELTLPLIGEGAMPTNNDNNGTISPNSGVTATFAGLPYAQVTAPAQNEVDHTIDFGFTYGTLGNYVWKDDNADGLQNEPASNGINGITVELYKETTPGNFTLVSTTTTANDGSGNPGYYNFNIYTSGNYKVKFPTSVGIDVLTSQTPTAATDGNSDADENTGFSPVVAMNVTGTGVAKNNPTIDAGYTPVKGSLGNYVWYDDNANGLQDEPASNGINGVKVYLYKETAPGVFTKIDSTTTATDSTGNPGWYTFYDLYNGNYKVQFPTSVNSFPLSTTSNQASTTDGNNDADATGFSGVVNINVSSTGVGKDNPTIDAGYTPIGSLGNYVWYDANKNGLQDEPNTNGINDIKVILYKETTPGVYAKVDSMLTTNDSLGKPGWYTFYNLTKGNYKVQFPTSEGSYYLTSPVNQSATIDGNSDANTSTGFSGIVPLNPKVGGINKDNPTIDAGYYCDCNGFKVDIVMNKTYDCVDGNLFSFSANINRTGGKYFYSWDFGDGTTSTLANPTHHYATAGEYDVKLTVVEDNFCGCRYEASVRQLYVGPKPVVNYDWQYNGNCLTYDFNSTSTVSMGWIAGFFWDFGNGTTSTQSNPLATFATAGTYNVKLVITTNYGCKDSIIFPVNIINKCTTTGTSTGSTSGGSGVTPAPCNAGWWSQNATSNCDSTLRFNVSNPTAGATYTWNFGDVTTGNGNPATHKYAAPGNYTVKLVVSKPAPNACADSLAYNISVSSCNVTSGGGGGVESKTLGDVIAVRLYGNAINSTTQVDGISNGVKFSNSGIVVNGIDNISLNALMPTSIAGAEIPYVSTPTDLVNFTNAVEVLAVDYTKNNNIKAVAFGTKTLGDVYTHTKPICDRLKGAELMEVKTINVNGYSLMAYKVRQRTGETEFAMNLSAGTAANRNSISLQSNWFTDSYVQDEKLYNFQLWAVSYDMVKAMAQDIVNRLQANGTVNAVTTTDLPKAYISNGSRTNTNLNVTIQNNTAATTGYFELKEKANENSAVTTRQIAFNLNANNVSNVTIPVKDNYEGNIYVYVNNTLTDLVYLADGTWSLDYNKATTSISKFNVTNEATIASNNNELRLMRNVSVTGTSKDYISIYKTMLGGGLEQNVSDYKSIIFNANAIGASSVKVTLIKKSITTYSEQYTYTQSLDGDKEYAINLNQFKSTKGNTAFDASDITAVSFSFNNSRGVATTMTADLSKVRFSKAVAATVTDNNLSAISIYPNPATTRFTANFNSDKAQSLVLKVTELATGRVIKTQFVNATKGLNKQSIELSNSTASGNYIVTLEGDDVKYNATKVMVGK